MLFLPKKTKKKRSRRESNPGRNLDRDQCYHYTTTPNTLSGNLTRILWMKATCLLHWTNSVVPETRFELATIALSEQRSDLTELLWNMFFILTFFFIHARARTWNLSFRRRTPFQSGSVDQSQQPESNRYRRGYNPQHYHYAILGIRHPRIELGPYDWQSYIMTIRPMAQCLYFTL